MGADVMMKRNLRVWIVGAILGVAGSVLAAPHRRNPGTTADLVTACLFVLLREGSIELPLRIPWSAGPEHG